MIIVDQSRECLKQLPPTAGVYLLYQSVEAAPIYIGKSINLRQRVQSHFQQAKRDRKEQRLIEKTNFIDFRVTIGEVGALLLEARLIKTLMPILNRRLRRHKYLYTFSLSTVQEGLQPKLKQLVMETVQFEQDYYGLFRNQRSAKQVLEKVIDTEQLCRKILGLEKASKACFGYQLKRCAGACVGDISIDQHNQQLLTALKKYQQKQWPYPGLIVIREVNETQQALHYINHWRYLGSHEIGLDEEMPTEPPQQQGAFSLDDYKIICGVLHRAPADTIIQI